jgi:hypothetical protein
MKVNENVVAKNRITLPTSVPGIRLSKAINKAERKKIIVYKK